MTATLSSIIGGLDSDGTRHVLAALDALMLMGPEARGAVPRIVRLSSSKVPAIRAAAASCLGCVAAPTPKIQRALYRLAQDRYATVRQFATNALHHLGVRSKTALKHHLRALRERGDQARFTAAMALEGYGAAARPAFRLLLRRLRDRTWFVRVSSAALLAAIDRRSVETRNALERQLARERAPHMRRRFSRILEHMKRPS